jgi:hypothetical protein
MRLPGDNCAPCTCGMFTSKMSPNKYCNDCSEDVILRRAAQTSRRKHAYAEHRNSCHMLGPNHPMHGLHAPAVCTHAHQHDTHPDCASPASSNAAVIMFTYPSLQTCVPPRHGKRLLTQATSSSSTEVALHAYCTAGSSCSANCSMHASDAMIGQNGMGPTHAASRLPLLQSIS